MCSLSGLLTRPLNLARKKHYSYAWAPYVGEANGFAYVPASPDTSTRRFQQNGAPPHFTKPPIEFLRSKFRGRLINRNSEHIWSPHSPDLSRLNFSLCSMNSPFRFPNSNQPQMVNETSRGTLCRGYGCRASPSEKLSTLFVGTRSGTWLKTMGDLWAPLAMCIAT